MSCGCSTRRYMHVHICAHAHTHIRTCTHAHMHRMHACTHAHMRTCAHAHMHTCTCTQGFTGGDGDSEGSDGNPEEDCTVTDLDELEREMKRKNQALKKLALKPTCIHAHLHACYTHTHICTGAQEASAQGAQGAKGGQARQARQPFVRIEPTHRQGK